MTWWNDAENPNALSPRERAVLTALVKGERISAIAKRLGRAPSTISTDRAYILRKLNLKTNADLVRWSIEQERQAAEQRVIEQFQQGPGPNIPTGAAA